MQVASCHVLLLPLLNSLARAFDCPQGSTWLSTGMTCFGTTHLVVLSCTAVIFLFFSVAVVGGAPSQPAVRRYQLEF
jgi:hypothetical protein